jgi:hypothetical protein
LLGKKGVVNASSADMMALDERKTHRNISVISQSLRVRKVLRNELKIIF